MFPKTILLAAAAALFAGNVMGGVIMAERDSAVDSVDSDVASDTAQFEAPVVRIASTPYFACNCPNNCSHKEGDTCKYVLPGRPSIIVAGHCRYGNDGGLTCV